MYEEDYLLQQFLRRFESSEDSVPNHQSNSELIYFVNANASTSPLAEQISEVAKPNDPKTPKALVIGPEGMQSDEANDAVRCLIECRDELRFLEGLYLGALEFRHFHENEVIDIAELLQSFPNLRIFGLHVGYGGWKEEPFVLNRAQNAKLETLLYQSHHDAREFAENLGLCVFPNLREMVLRVQSGYEAGDAYLRALFASRFPALTDLVMEFSFDADDIAISLSNSPLLDQLETLDLSGGWLTDDGVNSLLDKAGTSNLKKLTIDGHYASAEAVSKLGSLTLGLEGKPAPANDEYWNEVKQRRLVRRIRKQASGPFIIRLDCLPHYELSVLSELAVKGKVRFHDDLFEKEYLGEVLENPTWLDIAVEANRMQLFVGDHHHVYLEEVSAAIEDPDLPGVLRGGLTFGS